MKYKRKGFTLIELLAVIVILGLLMAIAIPSVTKYITQSRKKTVTNTISNYAVALTNQVNNMEYVFTETNTVYAVPIECIALEKGGTNPFGKWHQASNSYWAYVLVQYDDTTSSYTYGFTFKDSAGYGLYPTTIENLNESGKQINTDLSLSRPISGKITNIAIEENWNGFDVSDSTKLKVLSAEEYGKEGNGKTTCTLCQKGDNYLVVQEEKEEFLRTHCRITAGTGYGIGDVVTCGSENFYIIESNSSNIQMISKYNITLDESNPRQDKNAGHISFASSAYWGTEEGKEKYGSNYPVYVFDSNSYTYQYVKEYHKYLKNNYYLSSSTFSLITTQKLDSLGCERNDWTCTPYPWLVSETYWTGSASGPTYIWCAAGNNYFCNYDWSYSRGIRPVITVSRDEIYF